MHVQNVARYVIEHLNKPITAMKLEKLVYYCQAWSLAWDDEPLFEEDFQAWAHGPVCPELYKEHRGMFLLNPDFLDGYKTVNFTNDQIETMNSVIDYYGDKSPNYLSELTHKERPWRETRGNLPLGEPSNNVIPKELMQEYYGGLQ